MSFEFLYWSPPRKISLCSSMAKTSLKISFPRAVISICDVKAYIRRSTCKRSRQNTCTGAWKQAVQFFNAFAPRLNVGGSWSEICHRVCTCPRTLACINKILSAGEMLTTRRVKYAQYRVGIGKSDTPLKRWIYSLINPYTQHLKTPFLDAYIWIWMREKRHDIESAAFKGNLIFYLPCSTTRMARVRSSFRSSVTWWATRWTPPTIKKRWEMVSFEGSWFLRGLPI